MTSPVVLAQSHSSCRANIQAQTHLDARTEGSGHALDPLGRLKAETRWSAKTPGTRSLQRAYTLDGNGNRIQEFADGAYTSATYGDNNEMTAYGDWAFTYDEFGNTKSQTSSTSTYNFTWDDEGHLTAASGAGADSHEYDGNGRRMRSKLNGATDWTNFIYDETAPGYPCLLAEYTLIAGTYVLASANTHGLGLISTNRGGTKRYYHFDGLGTTWALTSGSGTVTDTYSYTAFGVLLSSTGSSVNPYRYVGQWGYYDDGARGSGYGLMLLGVRYYSATFGRFWSWDPATSDLYRYCDSSPTMRVDPSGKFSLSWDSIKCCLGLIGAGGIGGCLAGVGGQCLVCIVSVLGSCWWQPETCPLLLQICDLYCGGGVVRCLESAIIGAIVGLIDCLVSGRCDPSESYDPTSLGECWRACAAVPPGVEHYNCLKRCRQGPLSTSALGGAM